MSLHTNKKPGVTRIHQLDCGVKYSQSKGAVYASGYTINKEGVFEKIIFF